MSKKQTTGIVYLVGAGPGDPELATVKCRRLLGGADVLVYDYLANPALLEWVRPGCERLYVGKKGGAEGNVPQEETNALIVEKARAGKTVVRLKGGDPFVFGRGGEEAQELRAAGIAFEIVPGISSAVAAPAYAGIPVTHRDHCSQVTFLTGHDAQGREITQVEWDRLAKGSGTLVILMGVKRLEHNARALVAGGRSPQTPAALIEWGTYPRQRTLVSTLEKIAAEAEREEYSAPSIFVVGTVVELRRELAWLERRPLFGKSVLVTRARAQASALLQQLLAQGAEPVPFPTIEIEAPKSWDAADAAIAALEAYDWTVFTSANGVARFFARLQEKGGDIRRLHRARLAAIGPATAEALEEKGLRVEVVPREFDAEGLVAFFQKEGAAGKRVLIPRAQEARELLPEALRGMGARVDVAPVYQSVLPSQGGAAIKERIEDGRLDLVTFSSSSTVKNFFALVGKDAVPLVKKNCAVACIGPVTADTARGFGLRIDIQPEQHTIGALVEAIVAHYGK